MQVDGLQQKSNYNGNDLKNSILNMCDIPSRFSQKETDAILSTARSVGCLIEGKWLREDGPNAWCTTDLFHKYKTRKTLKSYVKQTFPEAKEWKILFSKEPRLALGTAFLIAKDKMVTTGHCFFDDKGSPKLIKERPQYVAFDFLHDKNRDNKAYDTISFFTKQVYRIVSILAYEYSEEKDWVVFKLDRSVEDRDPLKICYSEPMLDQRQWLLGYPQGTPCKWTGDFNVMNTMSHVENVNIYQINSSTFRGNSGSPIFLEKSEEVIGMLCGGHLDYFKYDGIVREYEVTPEKIASQGYEQALKMSRIPFLTMFTADHFDNFLSDQKYENGLTLEGICNLCTTDKFRHHLGYSNLYEVRSVRCHICKNEVELNIAVIFNCIYQVESDTCAEMFRHQPLNPYEPGGELRFDLRKLKFIKLTTQHFEATLFQSIKSYFWSYLPYMLGVAGVAGMIGIGFSLRSYIPTSARKVALEKVKKFASERAKEVLKIMSMGGEGSSLFIGPITPEEKVIFSKARELIRAEKEVNFKQIKYEQILLKFNEMIPPQFNIQYVEELINYLSYLPY